MVDMDTKATFSYKPNCWLDWNLGPGAAEYRDIAIEIPAIWPEDDKQGKFIQSYPKIIRNIIQLLIKTQENVEIMSVFKFHVAFLDRLGLDSMPMTYLKSLMSESGHSLVMD